MKLQPDKDLDVATLMALGTPGRLAIDTASLPEGTRVCRFPARWVPEGDRTVHLLDTRGLDACAGFELQSPWFPLEFRRGHWTARQDERATGDGRVFVHRGVGDQDLDRVQIRQPSTWAIPLEGAKR